MTFLFRYRKETDVSLQPIRNLGTSRGWWSTSCSKYFTPEKDPVTILRDTKQTYVINIIIANADLIKDFMPP